MNTTLPSDPPLFICSQAIPGTRFDISGCYNRTIVCYFFSEVLIDKCDEYCGSSFGYYEISDVIETFITWVIPLFALLAIMDFAKSTLTTLDFNILNHRLLRWLWIPIKSQLP